MFEADYLGRPLWYELMTVDPDGAREFYTKVVGWGVQEAEPPAMKYTMWTRGETPVGGLMELPEEVRRQGAPPHWLTYVGTPDIERTFDRAMRLGAEAHVKPTDVQAAGHFAVLSDPQGAMFALLMPVTLPVEQTEPPQVGDFSWNELVTTDHVAAFDFYHGLFGWEKTGEHDMGPMGVYQLFGRKGHTLGAMFNRPAAAPFPPHWLPYARVQDIQRAADAIKGGRGMIAYGPIEVPGEDWIVQAFDPQGAYFALHQQKAT